MDMFFSPPRRKRGRPKKKKTTSGDSKPRGRPPSKIIDLTPVQSVLSPGGKTKCIKNQGPRRGSRKSYAAHTPNGQKLIQIVERWGKEEADWRSISRFAKAMAVEYFDQEWRWETIRQRIGKRKKSKKGLDDMRSSKGLLSPTTRQALSNVLSLKDEKSEGGDWTALMNMISEVKPSLGPRQCETAALSVLKEGRKGYGPLKQSNMRAQRHTSKRCEV